MDNQELVKKIRSAIYSEAVVLMNKHTIAIAADSANIVTGAIIGAVAGQAKKAKDALISDMECAVDLLPAVEDYSQCVTCKSHFATETMRPALLGNSLFCPQCVKRAESE